MINVTQEYIATAADSESSFTNAKKIVTKQQLLNTYIDKEKVLIYGECSGSGKSNYKVSVDFLNPQAPVFRCSCPSRQIPCKHSIALLYQYFLDSTLFAQGELPEDIESKRQKIEKRIEKQKEEVVAPKKVNQSAFIKKMEVQVEGMKLVTKFIEECFTSGFASIPISQIKTYQKDLIKEMGNYYLPEFSSRIDGILNNLETAKLCKQEESCLKYYNEATNDLAFLQDLTKKSKAVLEKCIEAKQIVDIDTADMFTKMGYIWKLKELKRLGFYKENGQLLQLGFYSYDDNVRKNYVDVGFYINLGENKIYKTMNIRPYKISNKLKADDTIFEVVNPSEFYVYPSDMNPRIRWDSAVTRRLDNEDLKLVRTSANKDFKAVLKEVKGQLKNTLTDKNPVYLLHYNEIVQLGENLAIKDENNEIISLANKSDMPDTISVLKFMLNKKDLKNNIMLGIFNHDLNAVKLTLQPISVITQTDIIRFLG